MLPLLLALAAHADTWDVSASVHGVAASWLVEDAQQGQVLSEVIDLPGRDHVELTLDYEELADDALRMSFVIVDVHDRWIGPDKRTVLSRPRITTRRGAPAMLTQGLRRPIPGVDPAAHEADLVLQVVPHEQ